MKNVKTRTLGASDLIWERHLGILHCKALFSVRERIFCRFLFWLSGETTPSIQRSDVTGQMKTTLIKIAEQLKALSIDREEKRLFWVQFGLQGESAIASCDYNGNALHIIEQPLQWACCCILSFFLLVIFLYANQDKTLSISFRQVSVTLDISFSGTLILHWCCISVYKTSKQVHWWRATES